MIKKYALPQVITVLIFLLSFQLALAAIPPTLNYQGHLTDSSGVPIDGAVDMQFAIYDVATGGTAPLWSASLSVIVDQGVFSVELGSSTAPLPPGLFESPLWMGLTIGADAQMTPLRPISSVGFSFKAGDADTLEGIHASTLDQSAHVIDTVNPHNVSAAQTGAISSTELIVHTGNTSAHHTRTTSFTELSDQAADTQLPATMARDAEIMPTILANDGIGSTLDADTIDGVDSSALEESAEIDADITTHASNALAHHARYIDSEAVTAIKAADGTGSTLDADLLDGNDSLAFANASHIHTGSLYSKVAIVAQSGGDYTGPLDAMNDIAAWCGTASSTNPCLVKIMPGIYRLGNNGLTMQSYVDIEGSGENTTVITSTHSSGSFDAASATVSGADNAEIRFLTVGNQGGSSYSFAIYNGSASPDITNVTATATGGSSSYGVFNFSSTPKMTNVIANGSGGTYCRGVYNASSSPKMINVIAHARGGSFNYGVYNSSSSPEMTNVTAIAAGGSSANYGVYNSTSSLPEMVDVSSNSVIITGNQLFVPASASDTENGALLLTVSNAVNGLGAASATKRYTIRLDAGTYDLGNNGLVMQSFVDIEGSGENTTTISSMHSSGTSGATSATVVGADKTEIRFLTVENLGGSTYAHAIYNDSASPKITNVTATASGGTQYNYGVTNSSSSATLTNVTATASGGTISNGVTNTSGSSPTLTNVTATASGGTFSNYGMTNGSSFPTIKNSSISGWNSIYNYGVGTTKVGTTMLGGPVAGSGFTCVGVYDVNFVALDSSCL